MLKLALVLIMLLAHSSHSVTGSSLVMWGQAQIIDQPLKAIHAGQYHTLAIKENGQVIAWGHWDHGGRWSYYPADSKWPTQVPSDLGKASQVAAGYSHSVVLLEDGSVRAWGENGKGQLNLPTGLQGVKAIAADGYTTVLINADGKVLVIGDTSGGLGRVPEDLPPANKIVISEGSLIAALTESGEVRGWGRWYQTANWKEQGTWNNIVSISLTSKGLVGLRSNGEIAVMGDSANFVFNVPDTVGKYHSVACTYLDICAAETDSGTMVWGNAANRSLAIKTQVKYTQLLSNRDKIVALHPNKQYVSIREVHAWSHNNLIFNAQEITWPIRSVVVNGRDVYILNEAGGVRVFREESSSQVASDFLDAASGSRIRSIAAEGRYYGLGLENGSVKLLGEAALRNGPSPVPQDNIPVIDLIVQGEAYCMALKENGKIYAWSNRSSQKEVEVPEAAQGAIDIAATTKVALALKPDGQLIVWGDTAGLKMKPEQLKNIRSIATGYLNNVVAVKEDGTVLVWGDGASSYLKPPPDLNSVKSVVVGWEWIAALKNDGSVFVWGGYDRPYDYSQSDIPKDLKEVEALYASEFSVIAVRRAATSALGDFRPFRVAQPRHQKRETGFRNALGRVIRGRDLRAHPQTPTGCGLLLPACKNP